MKVKKACFIGNPNVGKSSLFNFLTHSSEHTGNWTGKTVACASSKFVYKDTLWEVVDLRGLILYIMKVKKKVLLVVMC